MTFSLEQLLWAVRQRRLGVTAETAASLVLALTEQLALAPRQLLPTNVGLTQSGQLLLEDGVAAASATCARQLSQLLSELLEFAGGEHPGLRHCARATWPSLEALSSALTQALVPMNRAAAKRALARLHRRLLVIGPPTRGAAQVAAARANASLVVAAQGTAAEAGESAVQRGEAAPPALQPLARSTASSAVATPAEPQSEWDVDLEGLLSVAQPAAELIAAQSLPVPVPAQSAAARSAFEQSAAPKKIERAPSHPVQPGYGWQPEQEGDGTPFIGSFLSVTPRVSDAELRAANGGITPRVSETELAAPHASITPRVSDAELRAACASPEQRFEPGASDSGAPLQLAQAFSRELHTPPMDPEGSQTLQLIEELTPSAFEYSPEPTSQVQPTRAAAELDGLIFGRFCTRRSDVGRLLSEFTLETPEGERRMASALRRSLGLARTHTETSCTPPPVGGLSRIELG